MPIYPYSFQLPPLNVQDIPNDGAVGEFLGISAGGVLDWLPVSASGSGDMLKSENLSGLADYPTARTNLGLGTGNSPQFTGIQFSTDTFLIRGGAANLHLGAADAAAPVAQTLSVQSVVAGTTNTAGQAFTIDGSQGTGTGAGGSIFFRTAAAAGSSGSTVNALSTRMTINSAGNVGIGTTTPATNLEVVSATMVGITARSGIGSGDGAYFSAVGQQESFFNVFANNNTSGSRIMRFGNSSANAFVVQALNDAANSILRTPVSIANTAPTGSLHILSSGNVGIGTTAPRTRLHLENTGTNSLVEFSGPTVTNFTGVGFNPNVGTNTCARVGQASVTNGGFFAVGFTTSANAVPAVEFQGNLGSTSPTVAAVFFDSYKTNGSTGRTSLASTEISAQFANGSSPLMTLLGSGNVGIGTTAPSSKLHVAGTIKPEQATMFPSISTGITLSTTHAGTIIISDATSDITVNLPAINTETNGFNVMIIQRGIGAVTIGANSNNLQSFGGAVKTAGQHAACSIVRTANNEYNLSGNLV